MLIGRAQELTQLQFRLERRETVALLGEAGVGKTALMREAAERSGRRAYEGGGLATLSWLPYLPVERALGRKIPLADSDWVAGEIERRVGDGVLLLDDLHWIDRETRTLLPLLVGRIAVMTTVRRGDPGSESAIGELTALGIDLINVEPLAQDDAAALVRDLRPDLSRSAVADLIRRAGRNPLLLEELASTGTPTESLQLALTARLRHLTPAALDAFALLALAGRPLPDDQVVGQLSELHEAGLVEAEDGQVSVRHALLAETAAGALSDMQRQGLHARLARLVDDPGESARHHLQAGERELALEMALKAAHRTEFAGERGRHLAVAAQCADGPEADALRLLAAASLVEANDFEDIEPLLAAIDTADPVRRAEVRLIEYAMFGVAVDHGRAKAAWKAGLDAAAGTGSDVELRLLIEEARIAYLMDGDAPRALELGERGLRLARAAGGRHETLARYILGSARMFLQLPHWDRDLVRAVHAARAAGDVSIEHRAANNLVFGLIIGGRIQEARRRAEEVIEEDRRRRLAGWERRMRGWLMGINWYDGELRNAVDDGLLLVTEMTRPNDRRVVQFYGAQALTDLGRDRDASALIDRLVAEIVARGEPQGADVEEFVEAMWAWADAQLISGHPHEALRIADECLSRYEDSGGEDGLTFLAVTRAWAQLDSGVPIDPSATASERPITAGAPDEVAGIADLAAERFAEAADRFASASRLWHGRHFRGYLRCLWAEGESRRKNGETALAVDRLKAAEAIALQHEAMPLLRRIERSLRLCGVRRSAPRSLTASKLTGRERQLLSLVGDGLTNREIAQRLGIGRPTVARILQSASRKLGAETRAQAASLAAGS